MLDKTNKVRGYFKYILKDAKTGEVLDRYEEENRIMSQVPKMYFELVSGLKTPSAKDTTSTLKAEDFRLCTVVLGNKGFDDKTGAPKNVDPDAETINALEKSGGKYVGEAYQATWKNLTEQESMRPAGKPAIGCLKQSEGLSSAVTPKKFNGTPVITDPNKPLTTESGLDVVTSVKDGVITFNLSLLEKTGNGITFSEAALFVRHEQDPGFAKPATALTTEKLGTIFSMKTFKEVKKTNACVLELEWKLDFNL